MPLLLPGEETAINHPWSRFERHHHAKPYAALIIQGSCDEAGDHGRFRVQPGDVLIHAAFDGHTDRIGRCGAAFINIALDVALDGWFGRVDDLDSLVGAAARDRFELLALLKTQFRSVEASAWDWPDLLALELAGNHRLSLEDWAELHGLHPASVSRGFKQAYGVSPKQYRLEYKTSCAARRIRESAEPISEVAAACGFADQAHMTRALVRFFGTTPATLRKSC